LTEIFYTHYINRQTTRVTFCQSV